ncbi:MAG: NADH-quinone oxidoreductase subunit NuoN [Aliidongia sp.]
MIPVPNFTPAVPEIFLAVAAMALLLLGVLRGNNTGARAVSLLAVAVIAVTVFLVLERPSGRVITFNGLFVTDDFARFVKTLILLGAAGSILLAMRYNVSHHINRFEFPILMLLATVGMMAMVSANDLISLYVGLELQSLALYVMAAFQRDTVRSTEAGLKYFVLGALSSGMLLFGASFIYGFAGTTNFDQLAFGLGGMAPDHSIGLIIGVVFLSVGIAFKCSAVPFHMWTPDVYEGAPTPVTAFFASAPKIAALSLFLRVMLGPFGHLALQWTQIIWAISLLSMVLGAYAAISQSNIKRLMAYSSIGNVGYALIGLAAGTHQGVVGVLVYLAIYVVMTLGTFGVILCMERNGQMVEAIDDLTGLSRSRPVLALALAIFMFSMAGIPPLAGFFSKIAVFKAAIQVGTGMMTSLAIIGVLTSVIGCYYYIRIVKVMYFDQPKDHFDARSGGRAVKLVVAVAMATIVLFILSGDWLFQAADVAAKSLIL